MIETTFDPFAGGALVASGPTTDAQREVLASARMGVENSLAYNEGVVLTFGQDPDHGRIVRALEALYRRHDALRSTFSADDLISFVWDVPLSVQRVTLPSGPEGAAAFVALTQREATTPFDLDRGPLVRATLVTSADVPARLVLMAHHLVCDGWSYGVLIRELAEIYTAGPDAALEPAPSYLAYANRERDRERSGKDADTVRYWALQFEGSSPVLDLPTDRPRRRGRRLASARLDRTLAGSLPADLRKLAAKSGTTLFSVLSAGWYALLHRLSGQRDLVLAVPASGQMAAGMPGLVGHCVNVLPLRSLVGEDERASRSIQRVNERILDAFEHQEFTIGRLLRTVTMPRDPSRPPVAVMFNLDRPFYKELAAFGSLDVRMATIPRVAEFFELFLNVTEEENQLRLECQYAADLFDATTVEDWLEGYGVLLGAMVRSPETPVQQLDCVPARTLDRMRNAWNATAMPAPTHGTVHEWFHHVARKHAEAPAVLVEGRVVSFGELLSRSAGISRLLHDRGVGPGALVAFSSSRSETLLAGLLGILGSGAAYVPVDPEYPALRIRQMLEDAKPVALITDIDLPPATLDGLGLTVIDLRTAAVPAAEAFPPVVLHPETARAYVIYTSGSTGMPKGVQVGHAAVVNFLAAMQRVFQLGSADRGIAVTTLSFDIAVLELFLPLLHGAPVFVSDRVTTTDPHRLAAALEHHGITVMQATPSTWSTLLDAGWQGRPGMLALAGGEALPAGLGAALRPKVRKLWNMYGPTETTVWSACHVVSAGDDPIPLGRPIGNTRIHVVDRRGRPVPVGVWGEILIGGNGVALGYLDRPKLTAERFVADPVDPAGGRVYRTGDLGRWRSDGVLLFGGRLDDQVKVRGHRIELGEIETALADHPLVAGAAAATLGADSIDRRVAAYYVPRHAAAVQPSELRDWLLGRLPPYMVPQHFVEMAVLPRTPNGKIDRSALPVPNARADRAGTGLPATPTEKAIAAIWTEVLGQVAVDRDDDFFELGGHSVLVTRAAMRVARALGMDVPLRVFFDAPRLSELAARLDAIRALGGAAVADGVGAAAEELVI